MGVQIVDPHLVQDMIYTFLTTPRPITDLTQTLDTPTVHHPATVITATSPDHFWQEVSIFNLMK